MELWLEGYEAEGNSEKASKCGDYPEATTLREAVLMWLGENTNKISAANVNIDSDPPTFWGCRFFDNETDARAFVG